MLLGLAQYASGELEAAHRNMSNGLAGLDPLDAITGAFVLANIKMALGQLHAAMSTYEKSIQLAIEHGEPMPQGTEDLYTGTSKLHREWGDLEATALALLTAKKLGEKVELPDWQHRWCIAQAQLKQSQGDLDGALDLLREAERVYVRTPVPEMRPIPAMKARLWVRQGKLVEALDWARERDLAVDDDLSYIREYEHATLARLLIAQHRSDPADGSIHEVMGFVERLLQAAEKGGRMGSVIEILVLQALACEAQGDISAALLSLERALTLAESEGYLRLFVDEGPRMARLLYEALSHGIAPEYVQRLLKAFPMPEPEQSGSKLMRVTDSEWVEPLSKRETEVLQLIAEGLTNQEIASTLYLSLNTVKVHTRNIYGKLDVHHRTSAVARARVLGLLPAT
jgi:LuxR family maltose regulon positive regulatory protein